MATLADPRLPRTAIPSRYDLELAPDLAESSFTGTVTIDLEVTSDTTELVLNAAELVIDTAEIAVAGGDKLTASVTHDEAEQRATLAFDTAVPAGSGHRLILRFTGILNDQLHGFYRSRFDDDAGASHTIATTQFEPADARRAFPCWDEPELKATFAVTLIVDEDLTALSNGAEVSSESVGNAKRRVRFAETMPMSTYLVAFVVGPFEVSAPTEVAGVPLRVATPPGRAELTGYATQVAAHALTFLASYFGVAYPHDKIDHVAIPDFAFGAMENLGCVTYRETALLIDIERASQLELQRVATVVAHETAHMWFGDLVTMRWWNGIWLNEAFATFMELTTTDHFRPDWGVWTAFGAGKAAALATDGLTTTRPVEFAVGRPEEAEAMFDVLTYQKGGSVLRMLEQYLGAEVFRKGISHYLETHAHANTETADLWNALESVSGEPVRQTMDSWILQGGYPMVSVDLGPDGHSLTLDQQRFFYAGTPTDDRWVIPVNLRASVKGQVVTRRLLLDTASTTVDVGGPVEWAVVNEGSWGFYRVRYSPELLSRLTASIQAIADPLERLSLVGDTWADVVAGAQPLDDLLLLLEALGDESDPDVWGAMLNPFGLLNLIADEEGRAAIAACVRRLAGPAFARLGWEPDPDEGSRAGTVRSRLVAALGVLGADPDVRSEAIRRHEEWTAGRVGLAPDLVTAAVNVVATAGGPDAYQTVLDRYRAATNPQEKMRYLHALGGFEDPALLARSLELCMSDEVRNQDGPFLVGSIMATRTGSALAWEWVEANWDRIIERFPNNLLIRMLEGITGLVDPVLAERAHAFLDTHQAPIGGPRLQQLQERMDVNVALGQRIGTSLAAALAGRC
ncbi:MAG: M1 family metallopeptidase [Actinomycetota bacterium]|nr:M1 family metallopeptidase [Actinomycetota bacterium]